MEGNEPGVSGCRGALTREGDSFIVKGMFYGVGVGPGDPELITLKGRRILQEADVICSPKSGADKEGIALSIVKEIIGEEQEVLELHFPMTRDRGELELCREKAAGRIIDLLKAGKKVAFITLGDPTLYSTYTYILQKIRRAGLEEGETIPGINSFSACAAAAGMALAEGDEKLAVLPMVKDLNVLRMVLQNFENVVLMKVAGEFEEVVGVLEELDLKDRTVFASRCGLPGGFIEHDLDKVRQKKKDYLSLLIIKGENNG